MLASLQLSRRTTGSDDAEMDTENTVTELSNRVDTMDTTGWLWLAWCTVSSTTIMKCFSQCVYVQEVEAVTDKGDTLMVTATGCWGGVVGRPHHIDDGTLTTDTAGGDWEAVIIIQA